MAAGTTTSSSATHMTNEASPVGSDQSWKGLYRAGSVAAPLFVLLTILYSVMAALTPQPASTGEAGALPGGAATLEYIAAHKAIYLLNTVLFIGPITLTLVVFLALCVALLPKSRSLATIGALVGSTSVVLCLIPASQFFGLVPLSDHYIAATAAQRAAVALTADGLIAQINAVSVGGVLFTAAVLIVSLAMLKGVFSRWAAYVGIVTGLVGIVCESLRPVIGSGYGIYGILLVWLLLVSWKLWQLSK